MLHQRTTTLPRPAYWLGTAHSHVHVDSRSVLAARFQQRSVIAKAAKGTKVVTRRNWEAEGVDVLDRKLLNPSIKEQLLHYGELVQAAYDNLGLDRCAPGQYGYADAAPDQLLAYTRGNYSVARGHTGPVQSTYDRYKLPDAFNHPAHGTVGPLIEAVPGKGSDNPGSLSNPFETLVGLGNALVSKVFTTVPGLLVDYIDGKNGGRALFTQGKDGRGKEPRGTFFSYVAVSQPPQGKDQDGQDIALVWRGTIFKEEWESNFAQDELALWDPDKRIEGANSSTEALLAQTKILPKADEVGVHAGFADLYTRRVPKVAEGQDVTVPSPRETIHAWLPRLLKDHNVSTITATGHSLGGVLATLTAFDVAQHLEQNWGKWDTSGWKTKTRPQVRLITYGSPRLGNATFVDAFHGLGIAALRVENKGDVVPNVPGIWVQLLTTVVERFSKVAAVDMTSGPVVFLRGLYRSTSSVSERIWPSRWGYFHVGQVLALDPEWAGEEFLDVEPFGRKHNLELYMYLLSLLGKDGPGRTSSRNPLLLNKSADLLYNKSFPADWWREPGKRGYRQDDDGFWAFP